MDRHVGLHRLVGLVEHRLRRKIIETWLWRTAIEAACFGDVLDPDREVQGGLAQRLDEVAKVTFQVASDFAGARHGDVQ